MLAIRRHILLALASLGLTMLVGPNSYALSPPVTKSRKKNTKIKRRSRKRKKAKKRTKHKKTKKAKAKRKAIKRKAKKR